MDGMMLLGTEQFTALSIDLSSLQAVVRASEEYCKEGREVASDMKQ